MEPLPARPSTKPPTGLLLAGIALAALAALLMAVPDAEASSYWVSSLPEGGGRAGMVGVTNPTATAGTATFSVGAPLAVPALGSSTRLLPAVPMTSSFLAGGAIHVTTPARYVAALYETTAASSTSSDATPLLSEGRLGKEYWAFGAPTTFRPDYVTVIGTQAGTRVTVTVPHGIAAGPGVAAFGPGSGTFTLNAGDVLNLVAVPTPLSDLIGAHIVADKPVAAFSGNLCAVIGASSCDTVFDQLRPVEAGGRDYVMCSSKVVTGQPAPDVLRVIALKPGATAVTFTSSAGTTTSVALGGIGAWATYTSTGNTFVHADQDVAVAQFLNNGQGSTTDPSAVYRKPVVAYEDPALSPVFLPASWNYKVTIGGALGSAVSMDGTPFPALTPIGATGYGCSTMAALPGTHFFTGSRVDIDALGWQPYSSLWWEAPLPDACRMTGEASVLRADVPPLPTVVAGHVPPVSTYGTEHHEASLAGFSSNGVDLAVGRSTVDTGACRSTAESTLASLDIAGLPAPYDPVHAEALRATSTTTCNGVSGGTVLYHLSVGGVLTTTPAEVPPNTVVPLPGGGTLTLNEQTFTALPDGGVFEITAVHLRIPGVADVKVLQAISDIHECPGPTPPPPPTGCVVDANLCGIGGGICVGCFADVALADPLPAAFAWPARVAPVDALAPRDGLDWPAEQPWLAAGTAGKA